MRLQRIPTALLFAFATTISAATFNVTNPGDSGPGTLRQAILDANATAGRDAINVTRDVLVTSFLPAITDAVDIDGTTTGVGRATIEASSPSFTLLQFASGSNTSIARDLVLKNAPLVHIQPGVSGVTVANTRFWNGSVEVFGDGNTIGGNSPADANTAAGVTGLILDGDSNQILRSEFGSVSIGGDGNTVGTVGNGNDFGNVEIIDAEGNTLEGNTITRSLFAGIRVRQASGDPTTIRANTIDGATIGVQLRALGTIITGNTIRNTGTGVQVLDDPQIAPMIPFTGVTISANSFAGNGIAIDLAGDGPTSNDPAPDADTGANNRQNFPLLTSAFLRPGSLTVAGTLTSAPVTPYQIELFSNDAADPEARTLIDSFLVTTDAAGTAMFTRVITSSLPAGNEVVTSTATNRSLVSSAGNGANETSEVGPPVAVVEPGVIGFEPASYLVDESAGIVTVVVVRTGGSEGTVTATYTTSDGSATAPSDYTTTSGMLTFGDGVTQQTFAVPLVFDGSREPAEVFNVTLDSATGGATVGTGAATVTIAGDAFAEVPAVSTWGMIAMALVLVSIALWRH